MNGKMFLQKEDIGSIQKPEGATALPPQTQSPPPKGEVSSNAPTPTSKGERHRFDSAIAKTDNTSMTTAPSPSTTNPAIPPAVKSPRPGWNAAHTHNTWYKLRFQANISCIHESQNVSENTDCIQLQDK
jgi:hypothetical protein